MNKINTNTPTKINYQVQQAIEQMVSSLPKGTDLGLCDVVSALFSGYFIESGGGIMPAVDHYLRPFGSLSSCQKQLTELKAIVAADGQWQPTMIQGYQLKPVDMTAYKRSRVKKLKSKAYDADSSRAVPAVPFGIMGTTGRVGEQRVAILDTVVCGKIHLNQPAAEMKAVYKQVAKRLKQTDIALFDAGFSLVEAVAHGVEQCVVRLAKNCTFGQTPGKVPPRTSSKGPAPSRHQASIVRPLARQHGDKLLATTEPDQTSTIVDEAELR